MEPVDATGARAGRVAPDDGPQVWPRFAVVDRSTLPEEIAERLLELIRPSSCGPATSCPRSATSPRPWTSAGRCCARPCGRWRSCSVVDIRQGAGTYVTSLEPQQLVSHLDFVFSKDAVALAQLLEARRIVEVGNVRLAAQGSTGRSSRGWRASSPSCGRAIDDAEQFSELDIAFHDVICAAAGNFLLGQFMSIINTLAKASRERTGAIRASGARAPRDLAHILGALKSHAPTPRPRRCGAPRPRRGGAGQGRADARQRHARLEAPRDEVFRRHPRPARAHGGDPRLRGRRAGGPRRVRGPHHAPPARHRRQLPNDVQLVDCRAPERAGLGAASRARWARSTATRRVRRSPCAGGDRLDYDGHGRDQGPLARLDSRFAERLAESLIAQGPDPRPRLHRSRHTPHSLARRANARRSRVTVTAYFRPPRSPRRSACWRHTGRSCSSSPAARSRCRSSTRASRCPRGHGPAPGRARHLRA